MNARFASIVVIVTAGLMGAAVVQAHDAERNRVPKPRPLSGVAPQKAAQADPAAAIQLDVQADALRGGGFALGAIVGTAPKGYILKGDLVLLRDGETVGMAPVAGAKGQLQVIVYQSGQEVCAEFFGALDGAGYHKDLHLLQCKPFPAARTR